MTLLHRFRADRRGVTAVEYTLLAATIGVGLTYAVPQLCTRLSGVFLQIAQAFPPL